MSRRSKKTQATIKKKCVSCGKEKATMYFYKVDSPLFPDGMLNTCRDCIRETIDPNDLNDVVAFLRQIDKPFIEKYWNEALNSKNNPIGEYMRMINSLPQLKGKTFDDSDRVEGLGTVNEIVSSKMSDEIETESGEKIKFDESLINKWGLGYTKHEYLKLEKFYQDMLMSYEVETANHKQMLMQLAKLSLDMDKLLMQKDYSNYEKVHKVYDSLLKSAGFRPIDRRNGSESTGLFSFSQVWAEIEKEGFIPPKMIDYPPDDIDYMLLYYIQFVQRLVGKSVSTEPPKNWREEVKENGEL